MHVLAADRPEFAPPPVPGRLRALALALLAHMLLLAALTWGVNWRNDSTPAVEAELWSAVPQQAAPRLVETPAPEPTPAPPPPKADPGPSAADIALAREKERKLKERLEQEQREKEKRARLQEEQDKKLAEEKKKKELEAQQKRKEQQEAQLREKLRQEQMRRMAGLAGASGAPSSTGTALKSAGPSASYAGKIAARVRPNIVFTEDIVGNPSAEVEVRCAPDGTIVGTPRLVKSSGSKAWDEAVIKALVKTEALPRDVDGRAPSAMIISFRPRD